MRDTPFKSVSHALSEAYKWQAIFPVEISSIYRDLRGGTVRLAVDEMSVHDHKAQSALTLNLISRVLDQEGQEIINLKYIVPTTMSLAGDKELNARLIGERLYQRMHRAEKWFLVDCAREWGGLPNLRTISEWAKELGRDESTLRTWRNGRPSKYLLGAFELMDDMLRRAKSELGDPMREAGLIPP